ncbi:hypothetical protein GC174_15180 [bacterium]|nr:hypothetical protein [bacterium]
MTLLNALLLVVEAAAAAATFRLAFEPVALLSNKNADSDCDELAVVKKYGTYATIACAVWQGGTQFGVAASFGASLLASIQCIAVLAVIFAAQRTPQMVAAGVTACDEASDNLETLVVEQLETLKSAIPSTTTIKEFIQTGSQTIVSSLTAFFGSLGRIPEALSGILSKNHPGADSSTEKDATRQDNGGTFKPINLVEFFKNAFHSIFKKEVNTEAKAQEEIVNAPTDPLQ